MSPPSSPGQPFISPAPTSLPAAASRDELLQRAAIEAARDQTGPHVHAALHQLVTEATPPVRQCLAYALNNSPRWPMGDLAVLLLRDADDNVRQSAVWAVQCRP